MQWVERRCIRSARPCGTFHPPVLNPFDLVFWQIFGCQAVSWTAVVYSLLCWPIPEFIHFVVSNHGICYGLTTCNLWPGEVLIVSSYLIITTMRSVLSVYTSANQARPIRSTIFSADDQRHITTVECDFYHLQATASTLEGNELIAFNCSIF